MSVFGFIITLLINILFIPRFGYMACAWASFIANLAMMAISYGLGQKHYPIPYNLRSASTFFLLTLILYAGIRISYLQIESLPLRLAVSTLLVAIYLVVMIKRELPLRQWPFIGKYFK